MMFARRPSALPTGDNSESSDPKRTLAQAKRRPQVLVACTLCQTRKCKCDGQKPSCAPCLRRGIKCVYETDGDLRRVDHLRKRNAALTEKCNGLEQLVASLQSCTDLEAAEMLQRVRTGEDVAGFARKPSPSYTSGGKRGSRSEDADARSQPTTPVDGIRYRSSHSSWTSLSEYCQSQGMSPNRLKDGVVTPMGPERLFGLNAHGSSSDFGERYSLVDNFLEMPEIDIKREEISSPLNERFGETTAFARSRKIPRSSDGKPDTGEVEDLETSAVGLSGESVTLAELQRVTGSMSDNGFPHTDAWMELFGNLRMHQQSLDLISGQQIANLRIPIHLMQPLWQDNDAPINRVISDYRTAARQQIAQGSPIAAMLDMQSTNVQAFFQARNTTSFPTVSEWASEINRGSVDVDMVVRLANVLLQTCLMRWLIQPSIENYSRMPAMIRPTQLQMLYPHMAAISTIPLPAVRDALIQTPPIPGEWFYPPGDLINCTWPYANDQCVEVDQSTSRVHLTARFEAHVTDPSNWCVDKKIIAALPELAGKIRIKPPLSA